MNKKDLKTFEQKRFKKKFILMSHKSRQESTNNIEKDLNKLMNNSNFGYDCRNNLDNCKFVPLFDEFKENYLHWEILEFQNFSFCYY